MTRTVVLHYHLFKNAGTSLDHALQTAFANSWAAREFDMSSGDNSAAIARWIRETPQIRAYSTHTALGPLPRLEGIRILPVILLRDPLERIVSAYRFERRQQADTWGARLARNTDLTGYVATRLARTGDRQCRNFQTHRLASMVPGHGPELARALVALRDVQQAGALGLVEQFDAALAALARRLGPEQGKLRPPDGRANASVRRDANLTEALKQTLKEANADDQTLLDAARMILGSAARAA